MSATLATFANILKEFYLGPIQEQLNNEVLCVQLFEKQSVEWSGRVCVIPVHIGRNPAVGYAGEGAALPGGLMPTPGSEQTFADLRVNAALLYGRFQVTGPAIASAKKGSAHAFISYSDAEMGKLVNDVKNAANQACYSGGPVVGFLNQRRTVAPAVNAIWDFTGDINKIATFAAEVQAAAPGSGVQFEIVGMDRYENIVVPVERFELNQAGLVNGVDVNTSSLDFLSASVPGAIAIDTTQYTGGSPSGAGPTDTDMGFAVILSAIQAIGPLPNAATPAMNAALADESQGIYGNLGSQVHFGTDRRDTLPGGPVGGNQGSTLQSTVLTCPITVPAVNPDQDRNVALGVPATIGTGALNLRRMQGVLDTVLTDSGSEPNWIIMHPSQRLGYILNLTGTLQTVVAQGSGKTKGEGGFGGGLSYAGIPIKTDRHCARGGLVYLKTDTWSMLELQDGGFADLDGSVLSRVAGQDSWEGFYRWYYNVVCKQPFKNGILVGCQL